MLSRLRLALLANRYLRDPERIGDGVLLKAELGNVRAAPEIETALERVRGYAPVLDVEQLRTLPPGTFGRAYADHMIENRLRPFRFTGEYQALAEKNTFALRAATTHDLVHVLTGFDTSWTGEIGVLAFSCGQRWAPRQRLALAIATFLYPIWAPRQAFAILRARRAGLEIGARSRLVLSERLEDRLEEPLSHVRASLGIVPFAGETASFPRALGAPG